MATSARNTSGLGAPGQRPVVSLRGNTSIVHRPFLPPPGSASSPRRPLVACTPKDMVDSTPERRNIGTSAGLTVKPPSAAQPSPEYHSVALTARRKLVRPPPMIVADHLSKRASIVSDSGPAVATPDVLRRRGSYNTRSSPQGAVFTPRQSAGFVSGIDSSLHPLFSPDRSQERGVSGLSMFNDQLGLAALGKGGSGIFSSGGYDFMLPNEHTIGTDETLRQLRVKTILDGFPEGRKGVIFAHDPMFVDCAEWLVSSAFEEEFFSRGMAPTASPAPASDSRCDSPMSLQGASSWDWQRRASVTSSASKGGDGASSGPPKRASLVRDFAFMPPKELSYTASPQPPPARPLSSDGASSSELNPNHPPRDLDEFIADLCAEIREASNLHTLILHHMPLRKVHIVALLDQGIERMDSGGVQRLTISFATLTVNELHPLCEWIASGPSAKLLSHLDLSHNNIGAELLDLLRSALRRDNCNLEFLSLRNNALGDEDGAVALLALLHEVKSLKGVDIGFCGLGDNSMVKLGAILQTSTNITHLILDGSSIGQRGAVMLLDSIVSNKFLLYISVKYMFYCNGRTYLRKLNQALKRNAARKLRQIYNSPQGLVGLGPRKASNLSSSLIAATGGTELASYGFSKGNHDVDIHTLTAPPQLSTERSQALQVSFSVKMMEKQTMSSGFSSSSSDEEADDSEEAIGFWEWRGLKKGYKKYSSNLPSGQGSNAHPRPRGVGRGIGGARTTRKWN